MKSTDRTPANSVSQTSLCCRYSPGRERMGGLVGVNVHVALFVFIITHVFSCCVCSPSDVISTRVQDTPAEPPLQVFPTREDRGVEGSVRLHLQGLYGAEDQQEAG